VTVKEPRNDDERLAALLDGKLDGRQREELLADLAASDDDYEVFADTASILRQVEEEDEAALFAENVVEDRGGPGTGSVLRQIDADPATENHPSNGVIPFRPRLRARPWQRWAAIAAGLGGIAVAATFAARQGSSPRAEPMRLAATLEHRDQGVPEGWAGWPSSSRGEGDPASAAQAGALLVVLSVAVQARDTADVQLYSEQLRSRYEPAMPSSPFRRLAERPGAPADSLERLVSLGTDRLADRLGRPHLELGAWVEAARLAADRRDGAFFQGDGAVPRNAERLLSADTAAARALQRVRTALPATGPPRWNVLTPSLDTLRTKLAGV
jgi:hypothetical protein